MSPKETSSLRSMDIDSILVELATTSLLVVFTVTGVRDVEKPT
jgi:hypothetical protein